MRAPRVDRPIPWLQAFRQVDESAVLSQAACLLLLGSQERGDAGVLRARAARSGRRPVAIPPRDLAVFPVPRVDYAGRQGRSRRIEVAQVENRLARRYGPALAGPVVGEGRAPVSPEVVWDLARRVQRSPTPAATADLMEACLRHPHELTRVAAAAAYFHLSTAPGRLVEVLAGGAASPDDLVRQVAATALGRLAPEHPRLAELTRPGPAGRGGLPAHTSLLVHGTWARQNTWWQPGGSFHAYLLAEVRPDLYAGSDRFEWSGGYSDAARAIAADELRAWVSDQGLEGLDLFTHSHGGSVSMLATQGGLTAGTLVLLSSPVHVDRYLPDFSRVTRVVSIRVHLDLVILVDGGGQHYQDPRIDEHVLPVWFDHFATHDPDVWRAHGVPGLL